MRFVRSLVLANPRRSLIASQRFVWYCWTGEGVSVASLVPLLGLVTGQGLHNGSELSRHVRI